MQRETFHVGVIPLLAYEYCYPLCDLGLAQNVLKLTLLKLLEAVVN